MGGSNFETDIWEIYSYFDNNRYYMTNHHFFFLMIIFLTKFLKPLKKIALQTIYILGKMKIEGTSNYELEIYLRN